MRENCANAGEVIARHYASCQPIRLCWKNGTISAVDVVRDAPDDLWVAPFLIDLQVNGFGGVDFQQDHLTLEDLLLSTRQLAAARCAIWLLALITHDLPGLM